MGATTHTRRGRRHLPKSKRLQLVDLREHVTDAEVLEAIARLDRSGVVAPIEAKLKRRADAERRASVEGFLFAVLVNTSRPNHKACELSLTKILNGLSPAMAARLGMPDWRVVGSYDRVHRLYKAVCKNLDEGWVHRDADSGEELMCDWAWFTHQLLLASIPDGMLRALKDNVALAVDGTDMQSCAQLHADLSTVDLDGEAVIPDDGTTAEKTARGKTPRRPRKGWKAKVLGVGPDGRNIYTKDPDARAGWRGGNSNHNEGKYIGREAHLGVAVPRLVNTDGVTWTKFGPEVPPLVLTAQLVPAGSHRAKSVLDDLRRAHTEGLCADAVVDAGYSLSAAEYFHIPLRQAGIDLTMQPVTHQRGGKPGTGPAREIDGHLFAEQMPEELVNLDANDTETFVRRAPYHYSRIKAPGKDGSTRWEHPLHAGTLRSREVPRSMRRPLHVPLIEVEDGADLSTLTAGAGALPMWQRCLFGTPAWWQAMGRRQLVESVNSMLHGAPGSLTDIGRGYTKLRDSGRIRLFFCATLSGYNSLVVKRWLRDHRDFDPLRRPPKKPMSGRTPRRDRARRFEDLPPPVGPERAA